MALIDSLRNKEGTIVYPKTVTKAIYDYETMQTLEQTIDAKFGTEDVIPVENGGTGNKINKSAQSVKLTTPRVIQINLGLEDDETTFDGTEDVTLGVTGVLPTSHGGTGNTTGNAPTADKLNTSRTMQVNLASTTAASFDGSANVTIGTTGILPVARGGTGNTTGNAATATKLATARTIQTNLASTTAASFDGSGNISVGVTGTLRVANGGTGVTSDTALNNLVYSTINNSGATFTDYHDLPCGTYQTVYGTLKENDPFTNTGNKRVSIIVWQGGISSERFILAVCIDGAQSGTAFIGHRDTTQVSWFSLLSQTNYGDYIGNYLSAGSAGQNYAFRNLSLNSINFDDVFDYNYVAAFSSKSSDYGTFPVNSGTWNQVMNFYSTHFIVQQMVTVQQSTSADRSNLMWIRQRCASSGSVWSNWTHIGEGSNPNLLINWDFANPVNQRGQTTYTGVGAYSYTIDRWRLRGVPSEIEIVSNGVVVKKTAASGYVIFEQIIDNMSDIEGKALTMSIIIDGQLVTMTIDSGWTFPADSFTRLKSVYHDLMSVSIDAYANKQIGVYIYIGGHAAANTNYTLSKIKLELGEVSTLLNDPPQNPNEELIKCLPYGERFGKGVWGKANSTSSIYLAYKYSIPKRVAPTVSQIISGNLNFNSLGEGGNVVLIPEQLSYTNTDEYGSMFCKINGTISGETNFTDNVTYVLGESYLFADSEIYP